MLCLKWHDSSCSGLSLEEFEYIKKNEHASFICSNNCYASALPFMNVFDMSTGKVENDSLIDSLQPTGSLMNSADSSCPMETDSESNSWLNKFN